MNVPIGTLGEFEGGGQAFFDADARDPITVTMTISGGYFYAPTIVENVYIAFQLS
jgi:hypothetical protein